MFRAHLLLVVAAQLPAQILVDTFAGGAIPSGVPAQSVFLQTITGIAWDPAGNLVFCDSTNNVIRRVRTDGVVETIAGTGVTGYGGDGGPALGALLNLRVKPVRPLTAQATSIFLIRPTTAFAVSMRRACITTVAGNGIAFRA